MNTIEKLAAIVRENFPGKKITVTDLSVYVGVHSFVLTSTTLNVHINGQLVTFPIVEADNGLEAAVLAAAALIELFGG